MTRPLKSVKGLVAVLSLEGIVLESDGAQVAYLSLPGLEAHRTRLSRARMRGQYVRITITIEPRRKP